MHYTADENRYSQMTYNNCGKWGLRLSAISLGLWHNFGGVDVFENGRALCRHAFDIGITHFDLANNYGPPPGSAERCRIWIAGIPGGQLQPPDRVGRKVWSHRWMRGRRGWRRHDS